MVLSPVPMVASRVETWLANKGETLVRAFDGQAQDDSRGDARLKHFARRPFSHASGLKINKLSR
jgi:hypothetical protein